MIRSGSARPHGVNRIRDDLADLGLEPVDHAGREAPVDEAPQLTVPRLVHLDDREPHLPAGPALVGAHALG
jgi:hypothetical protein